MSACLARTASAAWRSPRELRLGDDRDLDDPRRAGCADARSGAGVGVPGSRLRLASARRWPDDGRRSCLEHDSAAGLCEQARDVAELVPPLKVLWPAQISS
jgi:hypothetical protein